MQGIIGREKSYGEMVAEHVCGFKNYSAAELASAARRDAGVPEHLAKILDPEPAVDFDRYKQIPGAVAYPDGVIELPTYERVVARLRHLINTEPDPWFAKNYYDTTSVLEVYEEFDFGKRMRKLDADQVTKIIWERYKEDHAD